MAFLFASQALETNNCVVCVLKRDISHTERGLSFISRIISKERSQRAKKNPKVLTPTPIKQKIRLPPISSKLWRLGSNLRNPQAATVSVSVPKAYQLRSPDCEIVEVLFV